ncbi:hypothetical protein [Sediminitomix flava]|uniref:Uncharacterized protein n=1 Tax=Sediminitomix flava TaxID=379075 RepID=A0A315ZG36_SEDFL|nr:hypothetical protein [Sediminitomix flava]PWJ44282.1 hypothetical protein BC781_101632 [Sediminitomix flava]
MNYYLILSFIIILCSLGMSGFSQSYQSHGFQVDYSGQMEKVQDNFDVEGNHFTVFQDVQKGINQNETDIYRLDIIKFQETVTDTDTYFNSLYDIYSETGDAKHTTFKGRKAVMADEKFQLEGKDIKQRRVTVFFDNTSYTLFYLGTPNELYESKYNDFVDDFKFIR